MKETGEKGIRAFLFFLALRGEAVREEVRSRFPVLVPALKALGEDLEVQGETFRLRRPLSLSWFAPLFAEMDSPLLPERPLALERLFEAAVRDGLAGVLPGEEVWESPSLPVRAAAHLALAARAYQEGEARTALQLLGKALGLLEGAGIPFPGVVLGLLALVQEAQRPGGRGRKTAQKALERALTPFGVELAQRALQHPLEGGQGSLNR
ncbi:hypothetical protein [Thermus filiformis]|uniref:Uncharacterized protein n=1 Tax=Thermus filiformis TaxID=276 RepID=A0A0A2WSE3_THEFI|nr:hypothetical protein [Thermus filiformis]KGQ21200.2 hypothetical protein THFILI_11580 [Thermus filiformis]